MKTEDEVGLVQLSMSPLPLGTLRPTGWLRQQLEIQADGLTGHVQEFWPDIKNSGWIGGDAEGWERVPYWLDGFVPLSYLLGDERMMNDVTIWVNRILDMQDDAGWLGPRHPDPEAEEKRLDPWPMYVILKVLIQYESATGNDRIEPAVKRALNVINELLDEVPLYGWNRTRWQDLVLSIQWLYDRTSESWLLEMQKKVEEQGFDWLGQAADFPYHERTEGWTQESHVVNQAMSIKAAGVRYRRTGSQTDANAAMARIDVLDRYHGQAAGVFSGDECLAGQNPVQGTELCSVVEYMYSLENLVSILGNPQFADRLERIAFNALPATFSPDMWAHQYDQQANQVLCKSFEKVIFQTNSGQSNLFGLEPNFGCCTANMHQGWPKFASHLWMKSDTGLTAVVYAPCQLDSIIDDTGVKITVETDYPFRETVRIIVEVDADVDFSLQLRIPAWAVDASIDIDGVVIAPTAGTFHQIERCWSGTTELQLFLPMPIKVVRRFRNSAVIERGPLVYSLAMGEDWQRINVDDPMKALPHGDWEVYPTTPWNYALAIDVDKPELKFQNHPVGENPFSPDGAPVKATVRARRVPEWQLDEYETAGALPKSPVKSTEPLEEICLIPYGCTNLRLTEFPVAATT